MKRRSGRWTVGAILLGWLAFVLVATRPWVVPPVEPTPVGTCAAAGDLDASLFLIGDAGAPRAPREPLLDALAAEAAARVRALGADRVAIALLGDNVYPAGLHGPGAAQRAEDERRLGAQLAAMRGAGARAYVVPGNHDWSDGRDDGWQAVQRETRFVAARGAFVLPPDGCPGPAAVELGAQLALVFLDTQWWLQAGPRPQGAESDCAEADEPAAERALAAALGDAAPRHAIVLAHHPLRSGGPHGAIYGWKEHVFPLRQLDPALWIPIPLLGSLRPLARALGVEPQDLTSAPYRHMTASIGRAFATAPPLLHAAGHDHSLQLLRGGEGARFHLVSGAGSAANLTWAYPIEGTLFAAAEPGWARLDAYAGGAVELAVEGLAKDASARPLFSVCLAPSRSTR